MDALTDQILTSLGAVINRTAAARLTDLVYRIQILESVNEGLRRTLVRDRKVLYERIRQLDASSVSAASATSARSDYRCTPGLPRKRRSISRS